MRRFTTITQWRILKYFWKKQDCFTLDDLLGEGIIHQPTLGRLTLRISPSCRAMCRSGRFPAVMVNSRRPGVGAVCRAFPVVANVQHDTFCQHIGFNQPVNDFLRHFPHDDFRFFVLIGALQRLPAGEGFRVRFARLDAIQQNKDFVVCRKTSVPLELPSGLEILCSAYIEHCRRKGLSKGTLDGYDKMCRLFLGGLLSKGVSKTEDIDASTVSGALLCLASATYIPDTQRFLRFLFQEGYLNHDYSYMIPNFKRSKPIPSVYSMEEIRRIEASVDRSTPRGKRDYAIILMATRLGIRAGDMVKMLLEQLDFHNSRITIIQNKTKVPLSLPMVPELQCALWDYIENGRKKSTDPHVFLSLHPPYSGLTNAAPGQTVRRIIHEAGIEPGDRTSGSHAMRSSLASSMVNDNISYEAVRRTLGHTSPNAIKSYARIDAEHLRAYSLEPPPATGQFAELLYGKKAVK